MSKEAMWVIEKYLQLVKSYLPDAIADDVVSEIRGHLTEAAEEISEGEITVEAAKRVVAGFGAPLEVAKEYADSMATDQLKRPEVIEREPVEVGYFSVFTKAITLTVFWMSISWTMAIPFAWWISQTSAIIFPLFQFMVLAIGFAFILWNMKRKGIQILDHTHSEWLGLQRLFTFPENIPFRASGNLEMIDIMLTALGVVLFALAIAEWYIAFFSVAILMMFLLVLRLIILLRALSGADSSRYIRLNYIVDASILIFSNVVIAWSMSGVPISTWPMGLLLWWYAFAFSINVLYQLIIKGRKLWWNH